MNKIRLLKRLKTFYCYKCNKPYTPTATRQKYCGTYKKKTGCSYLMDLERQNRDRKIRRKTPEYRQRRREIYKTKHPTKCICLRCPIHSELLKKKS